MKKLIRTIKNNDFSIEDILTELVEKEVVSIRILTDTVNKLVTERKKNRNNVVHTTEPHISKKIRFTAITVIIPILVKNVHPIYFIKVTCVGLPIMCTRIKYVTPVTIKLHF